MQFLICLLPVVPMRKEPSHRSEMVSQLLFGEYASIIEEADDFIRVKCLYDDYEGWVQANQLTAVSEVLETKTFVGITQSEVLINGHRKMISIGSPVYTASKELQFGNNTVEYVPGEGSFRNTEDQRDKRVVQLNEVCFRYLYTPYLWGGKSIYGIDCSGFVQQVFKLFGVKLLRDAYLQATQGEVVPSIKESKLGDLAFFQNKAGKVVHVGIVLEENQIVHASGRVRLDTLDNEGILNSENGKRTHQLHSFRRFF